MVANSRAPRDGKTIEEIGIYDPQQDPVLFEVKKDRVEHWISVGAELSDPIQRLLGNAGIVPKKERKSTNQGVARKDIKEKSEN